MSIERLPLVIGGIDFTSGMNRTGYAVEWEERTGNNATTFLSGDRDLDILATKDRLLCPLNALWASEIAQLLQVLRSAEYLPTYYFRLYSGEAADGWFHGTVSRCSVPFVTSRGIMIKDGPVLTMIER